MPTVFCNMLAAWAVVHGSSPHRSSMSRMLALVIGSWSLAVGRWRTPDCGTHLSFLGFAVGLFASCRMASHPTSTHPIISAPFGRCFSSQDGFTLALRAVGSRDAAVHELESCLGSCFGLSPGTNLYLTPPGGCGHAVKNGCYMHAGTFACTRAVGFLPQRPGPWLHLVFDYAGAAGLSPHYDDHCVFVLQLLGRKVRGEFA